MEWENRGVANAHCEQRLRSPDQRRLGFGKESLRLSARTGATIQRNGV